MSRNKTDGDDAELSSLLGRGSTPTSYGTASGASSTRQSPVTAEIPVHGVAQKAGAVSAKKPTLDSDSIYQVYKLSKDKNVLEIYLDAYVSHLKEGKLNWDEIRKIAPKGFEAIAASGTKEVPHAVKKTVGEILVKLTEVVNKMEAKEQQAPRMKH